MPPMEDNVHNEPVPEIRPLIDLFPQIVLDYHRAKTEVSDSDLSSRLRALAQFFHLCVSTGQSQVASEPVDELWHDLILHTNEYRFYCADALDGCLDHYPIRGNPPSGYIATRKMIIERFGIVDQTSWPNEERLCWSVGRYVPREPSAKSTDHRTSKSSRLSQLCRRA
jgi:hypothetical protein